MAQRIEQIQVFCNRCQRATLHQRNRTETNHVLHLLLTLFCCGLWLPMWLLIAIVNSLENAPFLCTQCGQTAGQETPEQKAALRQQKLIDRERRRASKLAMASPSAVPQQEQQEAIDPQIVAEQKARARAEAAQRRAEIYADLSARLKSGTAAAIEELKRLPGRTDRVLRTIAGEGNEILFWFLRIATVLLTVGFAIGILAGIVSVLSSLVF